MTDVLLATKGLCKSFGSLVVTDDLTLDVMAGELHAVIGPNGAGKTTLIHQLSGLSASDAGHILFEGRDITRLSMAVRAANGIARSFQITSILPAFSALENVALAVQARSGSSFQFWRPADTERKLNAVAMSALAEVGLEARSTFPAGRLSHGEKRQLEIAVAIATNPKLLLLDEPLAGLGREESEAIIGLLHRLKSRFAILLVEHDMDAVFQLADRVSVLVYGRLLATGAPGEIRANADVRTAYLGEEEQV
jgi:branched-chain amino acid transport system ATP-binding protein